MTTCLGVFRKHAVDCLLLFASALCSFGDKIEHFSFSSFSLTSSRNCAALQTLLTTAKGTLAILSHFFLSKCNDFSVFSLLMGISGSNNNKKNMKILIGNGGIYESIDKAQTFHTNVISNTAKQKHCAFILPSLIDLIYFVFSFSLFSFV